MELEKKQGEKLRQTIREKDLQIVEQAKRLTEVDERFSGMKDKMKRIDQQGKLNVRAAEGKVEALTEQVGSLSLENKKLRIRYEETAAVVGLEYQDKTNNMNIHQENQEWEGKILELAAAEQTIDHLQDKVASERKRAKFLKQKLAAYEAKEVDYRGAGEHMQEMHERLKAAAEGQSRVTKKLALKEQQLAKTQGELTSLKDVIEGGRGAGEDMVAENKALKAKLEATLHALESKQSRLRKLEKKLKKEVAAGGKGGSVISGGDFKALHQELAGFLTLLEEPANAAA